MLLFPSLPNARLSSSPSRAPFVAPTSNATSRRWSSVTRPVRPRNGPRAAAAGDVAPSPATTTALARTRACHVGDVSSTEETDRLATRLCRCVASTPLSGARSESVRTGMQCRTCSVDNAWPAQPGSLGHNASASVEVCATNSATASPDDKPSCATASEPAPLPSLNPGRSFECMVPYNRVKLGDSVERRYSDMLGRR